MAQRRVRSDHHQVHFIGCSRWGSEFARRVYFRFRCVSLRGNVLIPQSQGMIHIRLEAPIKTPREA